MLWGGLRGAVSLALALAVLEHPQLPDNIKGTSKNSRFDRG